MTTLTVRTGIGRPPPVETTPRTHHHYGPTWRRAVLGVGVILLALLPPISRANHDAKRLYDDLLRKNNYNKLIRPVGNSSEGLTVRLGLRLAQLIDVDERNEIITLNMWVIQEWEDYSLRWNPIEYGGVTMIYVPSESIWLPDIVLYNNADGDYTVTLMTKATLNHFGKVVWEPPAIYKSHCDINVEFFPFDEQLCKLKFGSWTYDGFAVDLRHIWTDKLGLQELDQIEKGTDVKNYYRSTEWDLLSIPAKKTIKYYTCCKEPYPDITFDFQIRRKTLFYTINLLVPCLSINLLTCLTLYLPSDSGEKISLCITLLLSLSMFQLLMMELIPATSIKVPLMGKYILFTMVSVSLSVLLSVITLNINFRSTATHKMPNCTRRLFLDILPRLLFMNKPRWYKDPDEVEDSYWSDWNDPQNDLTHYEVSAHLHDDISMQSPLDAGVEMAYAGDYNIQSTFIGADGLWGDTKLASFCQACATRRRWAGAEGMNRYPMQAQKALEGVSFIEKHHKDDDDGNLIRDEWKYVALVIDRILFWAYISVCTVGGASILLNAPMLYNNTEPL